MGVHHILDELDDDLGVGLGAEVVAQLGELFLQREVVLYDAVVDEGEIVVLGEVGMGVDVARLAVGGPAGVGYAYAAADVLVGRDRFKVLDLALGLVDHKPSVIVDERHSGAVVTSVFEPLETLDENWVGLSFTYISYDSTHLLYTLKIFFQYVHQSVQLPPLLLGGSAAATVPAEHYRLHRGVQPRSFAFRSQVLCVLRHQGCAHTAAARGQDFVTQQYGTLAYLQHIARLHFLGSLGGVAVEAHLVAVAGVGGFAAGLEDPYGPEVFVKSDSFHNINSNTRRVPLLPRPSRPLRV